LDLRRILVTVRRYLEGVEQREARAEPFGQEARVPERHVRFRREVGCEQDRLDLAHGLLLGSLRGKEDQSPCQALVGLDGAGTGPASVRARKACARSAPASHGL